MLVPSYAELMNVLNQESDEKNEVTSRYTIVIAAAKRARQIIEGDVPMVKGKKGKPLSTAVDEIYKNKIKIVPEGEGTILNFNNFEQSFNPKNNSDDNLSSFKEEDKPKEEDKQNNNLFEIDDFDTENHNFDIEIDDDTF